MAPPRQAVQPGEIAPLSGASQIDSADLLRADVEDIKGDILACDFKGLINSRGKKLEFWEVEVKGLLVQESSGFQDVLVSLLLGRGFAFGKLPEGTVEDWLWYRLHLATWRNRAKSGEVHSPHSSQIPQPKGCLRFAHSAFEIIWIHLSSSSCSILIQNQRLTDMG